jgi:predicted nucleic acid-binding protein
VILVDTSIWIDHLHRSSSQLVGLLETASVLTHPMVIGELSLGSIRERRKVIDGLHGLPMATSASHDEVMILVERRSLFGRGLSLVDAHLLASVITTGQTQLWTRDKRLSEAAAVLGVAFVR